jgi:MFS family permease
LSDLSLPDDAPARAIARRVVAARALRGFADGFVSLLLPAHLLERGFSPFEIGVIATATLLGSGVLTLVVGLHGWRWRTRVLLLAACALMAATGAGLAVLRDFWPLLLLAFVGTLNPSGGDVSVFVPIEHALLARSVTARERTAAFARYSVGGTLGAAIGSLAAVLPALAAPRLGVSLATAIQWMFGLYVLVALGVAALYRGLPLPDARASAEERPAPLGPSRRRVFTLAALFSLDAFGGGFVVQSMVALWLFERYHLSLAAAGTLFFWTGLLAAVSFLVAARIAARIGLVRTMVFTHLPANVCLLAIPFCDDVTVVMVLLFVRAALSQMDVPTRSSYVMAIVTPPERPAAASVTAVPRSLAAAASPALAGWLLGLGTFGWPLVAGGVLKIVYDVLLLAMFHRIRPPEEGGAEPAPGLRGRPGRS